MSPHLEAWPVEGIGEVGPGTDLVSLLDGVDLRDGDVVLVTSKVVSKAEGRSGPGDRERAVTEETVRVVARRGPTRIVENRLGLVMAAAGVDASNVTPGHVVRLPLDPDASAARLRAGLRDARGVRLAVVVTDTAGRAWRRGQTDLAVGVAGLAPLQDLAGATDGYGNPLVVTAPAVADELAGLAELVTGKLGARPVCVVRGLAERVLSGDDDGPGARALLRPREEDLFALGAREAVVAAVARTDLDCFGAPAAAEELAESLERCGLGPARAEAEALVTSVPAAGETRGRLLAHLDLVAGAHGWHVASATGATAVLRSGVPGPTA